MLYLIIKQPQIHQTEAHFRNLKSFPPCTNTTLTSSFLTFQELNYLPLSGSYSCLLVTLPRALATLQSCAFLLTPCSLISVCHSELLQHASSIHFTSSNYHKKHPKHFSQLLYDFSEGYSYYTTSRNTQKQFPHRNLNSTTKTKLRKEKKQTLPKSIDYELGKESILSPCLGSEIAIKALSKSTE